MLESVDINSPKPTLLICYLSLLQTVCVTSDTQSEHLYFTDPCGVWTLLTAQLAAD